MELQRGKIIKINASVFLLFAHAWTDKFLFGYNTTGSFRLSRICMGSRFAPFAFR